MAAPSVKGFPDFQRFKILAKDELTSLLDQVSLPNKSGDRFRASETGPGDSLRMFLNENVKMKYFVITK